MSSDSSKPPYKPYKTQYTHNIDGNKEPVYQLVKELDLPKKPPESTKPTNLLNLVTFDRNSDPSKPDTTPLLNNTKDTNYKCCSPFRPRRKKLSKSSKKVGKKSNKKSGKVRKNKRKTRL